MITPYEVGLMIEIYNQDKREHYNSLLSHAWHVAAFSRQEKLPELQDVLINDEDSNPQQKSEQMIAKAKFLTAMFGGDIVEQCG